MANDNINTAGGDYVMGDKIVIKDSTGNNIVIENSTVILQMPGADASVLSAQGISIAKQGVTKNTTAVALPIRKSLEKVSIKPQTDAAKSARANAPSAEYMQRGVSSTDVEIKRHFNINDPKFFDSTQYLVIGEVLMISTRADTEINLRINRGLPATSDVAFRVARDGELQARIWRDESTWKPVTSSAAATQFGTASLANCWVFEKICMDQPLLIKGQEPSAVSFDRSLVQSAWRVHHARAERQSQTFVIVLKKQD